MKKYESSTRWQALFGFCEFFVPFLGRQKVTNYNI